MLVALRFALSVFYPLHTFNTLWACNIESISKAQSEQAGVSRYIVLVQNPLYRRLHLYGRTHFDSGWGQQHAIGLSKCQGNSYCDLHHSKCSRTPVNRHTSDLNSPTSTTAGTPDLLLQHTITDNLGEPLYTVHGACTQQISKFHNPTSTVEVSTCLDCVKADLLTHSP